jgi:uncharacterized protein (TIGR03086 family)
MPDPVDLFDRAAAGAHGVMAAVTVDQLTLPTPCREWTVQDLIDHMVGGPGYLLAALAGRLPEPRSGGGAADYRKAVDEVLTGLGQPGAGERTCVSPLGFEWTVRDAVAGTFMDTLIHTWDLAVATGQDRTLDPALVESCVAMFLPEMPERGRAAGIVGPAMPVPDDASPQERLLAAMGRQP